MEYTHPGLITYTLEAVNPKMLEFKILDQNRLTIPGFGGSGSNVGRSGKRNARSSVTPDIDSDTVWLRGSNKVAWDKVVKKYYASEYLMQKDIEDIHAAILAWARLDIFSPLRTAWPEPIHVIRIPEPQQLSLWD